MKNLCKFLVVLWGFSFLAMNPAAFGQNAPQKVILDTDFVIPPQDDGMALILAVKCPELQILGVTTVAGNDTMQRATSDALRVLEIAGRSDIGVYRGANRPLVREKTEWATTVHGKWWSDEAPPAPPGGFAKTQAQTESAVDFMIRTVEANPGQITIIAIGPLTNVAMAIRQDPTFASKVKHLSIMGGAFGSLADGAGNMTPNAEFNIWEDPEAASAVFRSGIPIVLTPLNVSRKTAFGKEYYDKLVAVDTPLTNLIKERVGPRFAANPNLKGGLVDQLAVATTVDPTLVKTVDLYVEVDINHGTDYGVTVGGPKMWEGGDDARKITVEYDVDAERAAQFYVDHVTKH